MAITENTFTGDGATVLFPFTFPYLQATDIKVSLDGAITTEYTLANATTIEFNVAPAVDTAIRIYRETLGDALAANFFPGSAIRSSDLNQNFTQNLYVTQESNNNATEALTTANTASDTATQAASDAATAIATSNQASADSATALANSTTAVADAAAAVATSTAAEATANASNATSNAAEATANAAAVDSTTALATANQAAADAATAIATANSSAADAATAISTANQAAADATSALSTATTAGTNASNAVTTANAADGKADQAIAAVANALLFNIVATVAQVPATPADGDAVEVTDATGIESFSPLSNLPFGFVGDSGLSIRIIYDGTSSSWLYLQYFPNDPDNRYSIVELIDGGNFTNGSSTVNGSKTLDGGQF